MRPTDVVHASYVKQVDQVLSAAAVALLAAEWRRWTREQRDKEGEGDVSKPQCSGAGNGVAKKGNRKKAVEKKRHRADLNHWPPVY